MTVCGLFPDPPLPCCLVETGADHIRFAVDWSFVAGNKPAFEWQIRAPIDVEDTEKIASGHHETARSFSSRA